MSESDDEKHPFEHMVENDSMQRGSSKQPASKKSKQTTLNFQKKKPEPDDDSDDLDDDDDGLSGFDFGKHKPSKPAVPKNAPVSSVLDDESDKRGKKRKSDISERILLSSRWQRGWKPLPEGWQAHEYRNGKNGDKYWVYSHVRAAPRPVTTRCVRHTHARTYPTRELHIERWLTMLRQAVYGETKEAKHMHRSDDEWAEILQKRHKKGGTSAAEEATVDDDPLAALLAGKRQRDEEEEATRAAVRHSPPCASGPTRARAYADEAVRTLGASHVSQVHEEMTHRMDTGVRVNSELAAGLLGK